jgi:nucleotidyltransferase substrate binding protein (TIGR01987 family)
LNKKAITLAPIEKALTSLNKAIKQEKNEFVRDSVIQRFEYSFELSWKSLQKILEADRPLEDTSVKGILREAGRQGLISSVELWFEFQRGRNLTSHTYNEEVAEEVYEIAVRFPHQCQLLIENLQKRIASIK